MKRIIFTLGIIYLSVMVVFAQDIVVLKEIHNLSNSLENTVGFSINNNKTEIVFCDENGNLVTIDLSSGKELKKVDSKIDKVKFFKKLGENYLIVQNNALIELNAEFDKVNTLNLPTSNPTALSGTDKNAFFGFANGDIYVYNAESKNFEKLYINHAGGVSCIEIDTLNSLMYSGGVDNKIKVYDLAARTEKSVLVGNSNAKPNKIIIADNALIISGHDDNTIKIWDKRSERLTKTLREHDSPVISLATNNMGTYLISGSIDKKIFIWSLYTYQPNRSLSVKAESLLDFQILDNYLAIASKPDQFILYEVNPEQRNDLIAKRNIDNFDRNNYTVSKDIQIVLIEPQLSRGFAFTSFSKNITVKGKIHSQFKIKEVIINGQAENINPDNTFSAFVDIPVNNLINIIAIDERNNFNELFIPIESQTGQTKTADMHSPDVKYYALVIGVDNYKDKRIPSLSKPITDGKKLSDVLSNRYVFTKDNIITLKNPSRSELLSELEKLRSRITENDNFLIFYAGHGYWDKDISQGYWLLSDADKDNRANWISNGDLRDYLRGIKSKHTLLISDACFSGGIFKTRSVLMGAPPAINEVYKLTSRKGMTSGTLTEVPDESAFINFLLKRLNENTQKYMTAESLFSSIKTAVINNSKTVPQYGEIQDAGDEGGDFIFIRK